ncbi:cytochrome c oxidase assembly protein Coa3 [Schizosaccharomyces osmophilus]|uniref:Cytochrome c oxidase assembly factor 3 n=1 Tax=Schizosaccharomyces osmophilus TaxID=2545709 RepID=A0AAE9WDE6_9SCHI|nr:cytochrome c oxidase assembly protein Coa3 [Schizosaccharomyces osmophilus]WBW73870.1 cytochrome c oxidase assembly protein Coa3 [Schizosaccharomyces osmophilus]
MSQNSRAFENARRPFRTKNLITALGLGGLALGTFAYSIYKVHQDTLEDVVMTPEIREKIERERKQSQELQDQSSMKNPPT